MPRVPRRVQVNSNEIETFHCTSRCVRQAFLCGYDRRRKVDRGHRRDWLLLLTSQLASQFAIDVISVSILSNHMHHLLRTRPDRARRWSDKEVIERWLTLLATIRNGGTRCDASYDQQEFRKLLGDPNHVAKLRRRLACPSWFMALLKQNVARRSNQEDGVTGSFWEGRFRSKKILDESALLATAVYIDLNEVRANIVDSPEMAAHSSIALRIEHALRAQSNRQTSKKKTLALPADEWLCPLADQIGGEPNESRTSTAGANDAWLNLSTNQYVAIVNSAWICGNVDDFVAKRQRTTESVFPSHSRDLMAAFNCLENNETRGTVIGSPSVVRKEAERRNQCWIVGHDVSIADSFFDFTLEKLREY